MAAKRPLNADLFEPFLHRMQEAGDDLGFRLQFLGEHGAAPGDQAAPQLDALSPLDFRRAFQGALDALGNDPGSIENAELYLVPSEPGKQLSIEELSAMLNHWADLQEKQKQTPGAHPLLQVWTWPSRTPDQPPKTSLIEPDPTALRYFLDAEQLQAADHAIFACDGFDPVWFETLARFGGASSEQAVAGAVLTGFEPAEDLAELDKRMLALALLRLEQDPALRLSVNASRASVLDPTWRKNSIKLLQQAAEAIRVRLAIEITETPTLSGENDLSGSVLELAALGVEIWLDDMGTGVTSLNEIVLPGVTAIKLDRSLSHHAFAFDDAFGTLSVLADFARKMGLACIVEGVEDARQRQLIEARGGSHFQGFFAGHPSAATSQNQHQ